MQYLHNWKLHFRYSRRVCPASSQIFCSRKTFLSSSTETSRCCSTVRCKRRPVLACILGYFDNSALFRNPLGHPFRKNIFVWRPWRIDSSLLHSFLCLNSLGAPLLHSFTGANSTTATVSAVRCCTRSCGGKLTASILFWRSAVELVPVSPTSPTQRSPLTTEAHPRAPAGP